jgi:hypothetical protein
MSAPEKIRIFFEDVEHGRFSLIGRTPAGEQFMAFVTGAFPEYWWSGRYPAEY